MVNYINKEEEPIVHTGIGNKSSKVSNVIDFWLAQCSKVQKYLSAYIEYFMQKGQTVIVEGVHLDPLFLINMMQKYGNRVICYMISLKDEKEHIERS